MRRLAMVILVALTALMLAGFTQSAMAPPAAPAGAEPPQASPIFDSLYIFILAGFVGFEVIGRVSPTLHTPLMSATNAISGISLVGSIVAAGGTYSALSTLLGTVAVAAAAINVVGGFMITDRMLRMFKPKSKGAQK
jgi:NAD(P) transhydrogenase subunit alpha